MSFPSTTVLILLGIALATLYRRQKRIFNAPYPPGPPGLPIIGNALSNLSAKPWEVYQAWAQEYNSDIIHLNMAGSHIIVLNTYQACVDLLEHRSGVYSSRPRMGMFELMGHLKWNVVMMPYGDHWRSHRRPIHQALREEVTKEFRPYQIHATQTLLKNIRDTPEDYANHFHLMVAQVILKSFYGLEADSFAHEYVRSSEAYMESAESASEYGKYLVEVFPVLAHVPSWFPGAKFKRDAARWGAMADNYIEFMISETEKQIDAGMAPYSFAADGLAKIEHEKGTEEHRQRRDIVRNVAGIVYAAGSETTRGTMMSFVDIMVQHPEVQRRAQAELDSVLPHGQPPSFAELDAETLPYVTAVVKEVLRYSAVTPLLMPHCTDSEDEYQGYRIPAKSIVFGNAWAMLRDEKEYPDADKFRPERFLKDDGTLNLEVRDPALIAFGFGRRICPGRHFAYAALWISIASLLKAFEFSREVDELGQPIDPVVEYKYGISTFPKPFKCRIQARVSEKGIFDAFAQ